MTASVSWPSIMTKWFTIQKINSKICSTQTTSQDVTALIEIWKSEYRKAEYEIEKLFNCALKTTFSKVIIV